MGKPLNVRAQQLENQLDEESVYPYLEYEWDDADWGGADPREGDYLSPRYPVLTSALRVFCNDVRYFEVGFSLTAPRYDLVEVLELRAVGQDYGGAGSTPMPGCLVPDDEVVSSMQISVDQAEALTMEDVRVIRTWFRLTAHIAPTIQIIGHTMRWPAVRLPL